MEKKIFKNNKNILDICEALKVESIAHQKVAKAKEKSESLKQIQKAIEKRWEDLKDNPKRMINSVLDKPRKSIVMDRLIKETADNNTLVITEGSEIKEIVREHFYNWTRKRNTDTKLLKKWESAYMPLKEVDDSWYNNLYNEVNIDELETVIQSLPNKKAPGQSNLQYEWFKNLPQKGLDILQNIVNDALLLNDIPKEWKRGYIYPIPKTTE
jgi:hypothetical protein